MFSIDKRSLALVLYTPHKFLASFGRSFYLDVLGVGASILDLDFESSGVSCPLESLVIVSHVSADKYFLGRLRTVVL